MHKPAQPARTGLQAITNVLAAARLQEVVDFILTDAPAQRLKRMGFLPIFIIDLLYDYLAQHRQPFGR
jgi:hypothetical protein